jgi:tripartite ATP-independent transporter DctP family solute receptor
MVNPHLVGGALQPKPTRNSSAVSRRSALRGIGALATAGLVGAPLVARAAGATKMRLAFTVAKDTLTDHQIHIFVDLVNKAAPGALDITIYPGSQLGTGTEIAQSVQLGTLESAALGSEGIAIDPKLALFEIPWAFPDFMAFQKAVSGPLFDELAKVYDSRGLVLLAIHGNGFRDIMTKTPVEKLADFAGKRIRLAPSPARIAFFKALGAVPITIEWTDTYLALQQGSVDGVEAFPIYLRNGKMYEQAAYLDHIRYVSAPNFVCVNKGFWSALPEASQAALRQAGRDSMDPANALAEKDEQQNIEFMQQHGVTLVHTDLTGYEDIRHSQTQAYAKEFGDEWLKLLDIA